MALLLILLKLVICFEEVVFPLTKEEQYRKREENCSLNAACDESEFIKRAVAQIITGSDDSVDFFHFGNFLIALKTEDFFFWGGNGLSYRGEEWT